MAEFLSLTGLTHFFTKLKDLMNGTARKVEIVEDSLGMTKSKNLLKNTAGTTTQNGITFTYNSDGSVTCNGTATADTNYRCIITLPQNTSFILSGCPTGGSTSTYNLFAMDADTWSKIYRDTGSGRTFNTGTCTTWHFIIRIANGQTVSNLTFYPMLRRADIYADDAEFEPYSDDLQTQIDGVLPIAEDSGWKTLAGDVRYRKCGKCVEVRGDYTPTTAGGGFIIGTLPEGFRPSNYSVESAFSNGSSTKFYKIAVQTDGSVVISGENQNAFTANTAYRLHLCFLID